jgi:hypothetical protein
VERVVLGDFRVRLAAAPVARPEDVRSANYPRFQLLWSSRLPCEAAIS